MPVGYVTAQLKVINPENYKEYVDIVSEVVKKIIEVTSSAFGDVKAIFN